MANSEIDRLKALIDERIRDKHGVEYVNFDAKMICIGWFLAKGVSDEAIISFIDEAAKKVADSVDKESGDLVFDNQDGKNHEIMEALVDSIVDGSLEEERAPVMTNKTENFKSTGDIDKDAQWLREHGLTLDEAVAVLHPYYREQGTGSEMRRGRGIRCAIRPIFEKE